MSVRLRRLQSIIDDQLPLAPVHDAFDIRLTSVRPGRCAARMPATLLHGQRDPRSAGPLLVLADAVLGVAISSTLPEDRGVTTLRLSMRTSASRWPESGWLTASAAAADVDHESGTSRGEVRDQDGGLLAAFDTRCASIPSPEHWLHTDLVAPGQRTDRRPAGDLDLELDAGSDQMTLRARTGSELGNARGAVQGGVLALLADLLLVPLLDRRDGPGGPLRHDVDVHYLRGVGPGGVTGRGERVHPGRRLSTARAELSDATGRPVITATGLAYTGG